MLLPKRFQRLLSYALLALTSLVLIYVVRNSHYFHNTIKNLNPIFLFKNNEFEDGIPREFLVDIAFKKCSRIFPSKCSISDEDTMQSDNVSWRKVKPLYLKDQQGWNFDSSQTYLFVKTVNISEAENDMFIYHNFYSLDRFVNQIAVYNKEELEKLNIDSSFPLTVIKDFNDNTMSSGSSFYDQILENIDYTKTLLGLSEDISANEQTIENLPDASQVAELGWVEHEYGVWVKKGHFNFKKSIQGLDILYGPDAVDPRLHWYMIKSPLMVDKNQEYSTFFTLKNELLYQKLSQFEKPILKLNPNNKFKILQVADLHFSTGPGICRDPFPEESAVNCVADHRTLKFLRNVLDTESPDLVVLTGDQIFGETSPDALTTLLKALAIFIDYKIPFATTLGNHDDESTLTRKEIMDITSYLPYSLSLAGPEKVDGIGNYYLSVKDVSTEAPAVLIWFLDTHKYSPTPKTNPGYDWLKDSQLDWMENMYADLKGDIGEFKGAHVSMAFFHIPIPEYRNFNQKENNVVGAVKEAVTASTYNAGARGVLRKLGVSVVSVGHDHCNDYCLFDTLTQDGEENDMWLCYGGAAGEGGYGGYGGTSRRLRIFEIDSIHGRVTSWKRLENNPETIVDQQILADQGVAIR